MLIVDGAPFIRLSFTALTNEHKRLPLRFTATEGRPIVSNQSCWEKTAIDWAPIRFRRNRERTSARVSVNDFS